MGLDLSNAQIARELGLAESDLHEMASLLREGVYEKRAAVVLSGAVEADDRAAGAVVFSGRSQRSVRSSKKKHRKPRRRRLKGRRGRGTAAQDKPPVLGLIARNGLVRIWMLANVQRKTIEPLIRQSIAEGSTVYTDEYCIYNWLSNDYVHKTVNHSQGEYARDEDGDGRYEVHVNTMECFWSLLRPWLRVHRGLSQERLPYYLGFFECLYNLRKRGQLALSGLLTLLLTT